MADTIGRAVRDAVVNTGIVGERVYRDLGPEDAEMPVVTFNEHVGQVAPIRGDGSTPLAYRRLLQVSLFQRREDEDFSLVETLVAALDAADLSSNDHTIVGCTVSDVRRLPDPEDWAVQHALTLRITYLV